MLIFSGRGTESRGWRYDDGIRQVVSLEETVDALGQFPETHRSHLRSRTGRGGMLLIFGGRSTDSDGSRCDDGIRQAVCEVAKAEEVYCWYSMSGVLTRMGRGTTMEFDKWCALCENHVQKLGLMRRRMRDESTSK